jgi:hypothetical protein
VLLGDFSREIPVLDVRCSLNRCTNVRENIDHHHFLPFISDGIASPTAPRVLTCV